MEERYEKNTPLQAATIHPLPRHRLTRLSRYRFDIQSLMHQRMHTNRYTGDCGYGEGVLKGSNR